MAVDERAVQAPLVLDHERVAATGEDCVLPRDGHVVEEDVAVGGAPDRGSLALEREVLARPTASRADDECRALDVLQPGRGLLGDLAGRVAERRLAADLLLL